MSLTASAAALSGLTKDTTDPEGGRIYRDQSGDFTGLLACVLACCATLLILAFQVLSINSHGVSNLLRNLLAGKYAEGKVEDCVVCRENAMQLVTRTLPKFTLEEKKKTVLAACRYLLSKGSFKPV